MADPTSGIPPQDFIDLRPLEEDAPAPQVGTGIIRVFNRGGSVRSIRPDDSSPVGIGRIENLGQFIEMDLSDGDAILRTGTLDPDVASVPILHLTGSEVRLGIEDVNDNLLGFVMTAVDEFAFGPVADLVASIDLGTEDDPFRNLHVEGFSVETYEEIVDLTDLGAKFVALAETIPSGSVIISAKANIEALVVAGGTTVKVALGINDGDVDKYGITTNLTKNQKITKVMDWAVLSAEEQIDVCGVLTDGSDLGGANITAGSVRVQITYLKAVALPNAA